MKEQSRDWQIALLFLFVITLVSGRLVMTRWTDDLILAQGAAILGGMLGLALGASQFSVKIRGWLAAAYTPLLLTWILLGMVPGAEDLSTRLASLGGRVGYGIGQLVNAEEVADPLLFVAFASLILWLIGLVSGQAIQQPGRLLAGLLPPTLLIFLIQYYDGYPASRIWMVAVYLGVILLVIGRKNYLKNEKEWREKGVFTGPEPEFDLNRSVVLVVILIVFLAWTLPTPASALPAAARWWRENSRPLEKVKDRIGKALAALTAEQPPAVERYGDLLTLGSKADQGQGILFRVRTQGPALTRYYWRARVYDRYENQRWESAGLAVRPFLPEKEDLPSPTANGQIVEFEFEWLFAGQATLLSQPQPVWVSRAAELRYVPLPEGRLDVERLRASVVLAPGERYQARSIVAQPTVLELRQAGEDYPEWVRKRYLNLPENFSERIVTLAAEITQDAPSPYDKAQQITNYLRQNITYNENVPFLLPGADALERFLFDWKRGYCTYYASAEVLMLRAVGVPARLAVGYAQGERANGLYVVRSKDAHAWPEVYFPKIGWIEFEPTGNQPSLQRPSGLAPEPRPNMDKLDPDADLLEYNEEDFLSEPPANLPQTPRSSFIYQPVFEWIIITTVIGLSLYGLWRLHKRFPFQKRALKIILVYYAWRNAGIPIWLKRWQRWSELSEVERAFHTINQSLRWLNQAQPESFTPAERVALLKKLLPQAAPEIETLAREHEINLYSPQPGNPVRAQQAAWQIKVSLARALFGRFFEEQPYE
ncbi:MAG: transglutaminaseTgpA domain-containing protein [Anaerolineales bacterium]|jgi:transglutaminase-like putative cysteine protease|nr:transglutaminaseTgpA domain-containing protein [Anaerolineales bacterium]